MQPQTFSTDTFIHMQMTNWHLRGKWCVCVYVWWWQSLQYWSWYLVFLWWL